MATTRLDENLGTVGYDNLFVENVPEADVAMIKLAASQGVLKRGTLVSGTPGGNMSAVAAALADTVTVAESAGTMNYTSVFVLADDVDTGTAVTNAVAYRTGHFNRAALITKSYTLTAADEEYLRGKGILLSDALEY